MQVIQNNIQYIQNLVQNMKIVYEDEYGCFPG